MSKNHGNLRGPPQGHLPPRNKALIRPYEGKPMVNRPLIRTYLLGGGSFGGGYLRFPCKNVPLLIEPCRMLPQELLVNLEVGNTTSPPAV